MRAGTLSALADCGTLAVVCGHAILRRTMAGFTGLTICVRRCLTLALMSTTCCTSMGTRASRATGRSQAFELVYGLGYEWVREGHLRGHPCIYFPLNAFLYKK